METKPTYSDFFREFNGKLSYANIILRIPSVRWRFYSFLILVILLVGSFMMLFSMYYPVLGWWAIIITIIFCFLLVLFISSAMERLNKWDLKAMLKVYGKQYNLSKQEETKLTLLVNRLRFEELKEYFKEDMHHTDYISTLKEDAKESADETKKDIKITSLGIVSVALVILSAYLSALFNLWKDDSFAELSKKTLVIALFAGTFCWIIYLMKEFHLFVANRTHNRHMELYRILKDLEKKSKFR